ncbi:hypothetical protein PR202_gb26748 [Eleusine coracana subsp. coracana]|uniref:Uncharacterized protein n=1 Tax=Eleusine coracana subsp. coracana TaxID=191504 RepID=A0AAV5D660_ELECO|nr:hypothetical protein QOZ80_1BG0054850 [Eleusine coracana subsp. coracana]KAK3163628.1 hypothetical protein QOZ80_1AG0006130 [Eleusine coracana subsp. coracana]GJN06107.1 hypothetical protein PR202_ga23800 [Eleusine coracana subsp. coracana]GJN37762.1 hypothetical protein PR202_gb26748 [Eleusine coracana subsp. coracana]
MADWGPVLIAVLFFIVLTPGLLIQIPGNNGRFAELHSMRTSGAAIFVHTLLFFGFCAIFMIAVGVHIYSG